MDVADPHALQTGRQRMQSRHSPSSLETSGDFLRQILQVPMANEFISPIRACKQSMPLSPYDLNRLVALRKAMTAGYYRRSAGQSLTWRENIGMQPMGSQNLRLQLKTINGMHLAHTADFCS